MDDVVGGRRPDHQKDVDKVAAALRIAEQRAEDLMVALGGVGRAMASCRKATEAHPSLYADAHAAIGAAAGHAGQSFQSIKAGHDALEEVRQHCGLPMPSPQGGGGGGK